MVLRLSGDDGLNHGGARGRRSLSSTASTHLAHPSTPTPLAASSPLSQYVDDSIKSKIQ